MKSDASVKAPLFHAGNGERVTTLKDSPTEVAERGWKLILIRHITLDIILNSSIAF
jgi:hypothetical protein